MLKKIILVIFALAIGAIYLVLNEWSNTPEAEIGSSNLGELDYRIEKDTLKFDSLGRMWFMSDYPYEHAMYLYDSNGAPIEIYTQLDIGFEPDDFAINIEGLLLVRKFDSKTKADKLAFFDGAKWRVILDKVRILQYGFTSQGDIWAYINEEDKVWIFDNNEWKRLFPHDSNSYENDASDIEFDYANRAWLSSCNEGLRIYDGKKWTTYNSENSSILGNRVSRVFFDQQNRGWLINQCLQFFSLSASNEGSGISILDGNDWINYTSVNSDLPDSVKDLAFDREGNAWILGSIRTTKHDTENILAILEKDVWEYFYLDSYVGGIEADHEGRIWLMIGGDAYEEIIALPTDFSVISQRFSSTELRFIYFSQLLKTVIMILLINIWLVIARIQWLNIGVGMVVGLIIHVYFVFEWSVYYANPGTFATVGIIIGGLIGYRQKKRGRTGGDIKGMVLGGALGFIIGFLFLLLISPQ